MINMAKRVYNADSIQILDNDRDRVRKRPTIYIPSKDERGSMHLIFEIIDNSIDELSVSGSVGDNVTTTFDTETKVFTVVDNGSGIPQQKLLDAFLTDLAIPFSLNQSIAFSISPSVAFNAFLQSSIPALVFSLNSLT